MGCCVGKRLDKVNPQPHGQTRESQDKNDGKSHEISETKSLRMCVEENTSIARDIIERSRSGADTGPQQQKSKQEGGDIQLSPGPERELLPLRGAADKWTPKAVAFDINFRDTDMNFQSTPRKFPRRLKKLEGTTPLTAEQLKTKQELVDLNRSKELQRKTETLSKHNRDLFQARERERLKSAQNQLERKFIASQRNRDDHVNKVIRKQREREQKAEKVREKSRVELEGSVIHVDETYSSANTSEDEDWGTKQNEQDVRISNEVQDESSTDEFFESNGRAHLSKIYNSTSGFFFL